MSGRNKPGFKIIEAVEEDNGISFIIAFVHALPGREIFEGLASTEDGVLDIGLVDDEHFIALHSFCNENEVTEVLTLFVQKKMRKVIERIGQLVSTYQGDN